MTARFWDDLAIGDETFPIVRFTGVGWFDPRDWPGTSQKPTTTRALWPPHVGHYRYRLLEDGRLLLTGLNLQAEAEDEVALQRARMRVPIGFHGPFQPGDEPVALSVTGTLLIGERGCFRSPLPSFGLAFRNGVLVTSGVALHAALLRWRQARDSVAEAQALRKAEEAEHLRERASQRSSRAAFLRSASARVLANHPNAVEGTWFDGVCPSCAKAGRLRVCEDTLVLCRECYTKW